MKIDGAAIAAEILENLKGRADKLKEKGITPHLYVLLLTDDPSIKAYVNQKSLKSEQIGTEITVETVDPNISNENLLQKIEILNKDNKVQGIIVQRPVSPQINEDEISNAIDPKKDIDGFHPNSLFGIPVALAVVEILRRTHPKDFEEWMKSQVITVIGKGLTAGGPIIKTLIKMGITPNIVTSKTENKEEILRSSDIIISCVGKANIVTSSNIKQGVILIGVGMHKNNDGKLKGDYDEEDITTKASFYTPTPKGVGPVNVSKLLENLIIATEQQA